MKTLGVIGGLGPMATAYFLELVTMMTDASCDQEHMKVVIWSRPDTPDRTRFILGLSKEDPREVIVDSGRRLVSQGARCLAIPCITAHYFHDEIEKLIGYPVINLPAEVVSHLKTYGWNRIGIMATDGTIQTGLFQRELEKQGMSAVVPSPESQKKVMHLIYDDIKANKPIEMNLFREVVSELKGHGAQVVVLGCTELSLIKQGRDLGMGILDAMEVLARTAIENCGAPLKKEYNCLITGQEDF
ncbi:MAG: amino acid racemase [Lachnospiraceae bacterium]|nr:amino acid racemase [Lachnospiraceae bacterium]